MFSKALIFALVAVINCVPQLTTYGDGYSGYSGYYGAGLGTYGIPVYRSSANYGGVYSANGYGYGANLGRYAGLGALRTTGSIVGSGALGYGTGALVAQVPAVSTVGVGSLGYGVGSTLGYGVGSYGLSNLNVARGVSVHQAGPVNAAVQTVSRTVDYRPVPYSGEPATVQDIDVPPQESPLRINFQSKSSPLAITQQHIPAEPGQTQVTHSEDEPQTAIHNVVRPVVQQVNEVIQPFRSLTQTVEPVIEQTHTNIAQGEGVRLTGLTSGVVGGTGVLAASGVGVAAPAVSVAAPAVAVAAPAVGITGYRTAVAQPAGVIGLGHNRLYGTGVSGVYGTGARLYNTGYQGFYGSRAVATPAHYGAGIRYGGYGLGGGVGYSTGYGLGLNGLSGLSTYGQTAKVIRY